jgi:hypothetical protein
MKIKLSTLRKVVRDTIAECYGWPVEKVDPLYGVQGEDPAAEAPRDPSNPNLKLPKGMNSRSPENKK